MNTQPQASRESERGRETGQTSSPTTPSRGCNSDFRYPQLRTAESPAHTAHNPVHFTPQAPATQGLPEGPAASRPSSDLYGIPTVNQVEGAPRHPHLSLPRLPSYSLAASPSNYGTHSGLAENFIPVSGVNLASPAPRYATQDDADHPTEKQGRAFSKVSPVDEVDEKELRSSPIQEQDTSLPFPRDVDHNVARTCGTGGWEDLNMEAKILHLRAIHSGEFERYNRGYCYAENYYREGEPTIQPLTRSFEGPAPPQGWKALVHPEGTRYFYRDYPDDPVPVLTDAWVFDDDQYAQVVRYMSAIFDYMNGRGISFRKMTPPQYVSPAPRIPRRRRTRNGSVQFNSALTNDPFEDSYPQHLAPTVLVLDIRLSGNMGYYFVSHPTQTLFWLDPFDYSIAVGEVHTDYTQTLIGLEMKRHYWLHNELFPHLYELEERDIEEVDNMVGFALGDALTSLTGTSTIFNQDQLKKIEHLIHRYDTKKWDRRRKSTGERRLICRILGDFHHERFLNLYGERGARLNSTQSVHYSPDRRKKYISGPLPPPPTQAWYKRLFQNSFKAKVRHNDEGEEEPTVDADPAIDSSVIKMQHNSLWMDILSFVMFGSPGVHMKKLRETTVDRIVSKNVLARHMQKMMEEWRDVTLYGTVLLAANVSFLTIQTVDNAGAAGRQRTGSQRASYFSIMTSIATIVSSFLLVGRHREVMNYTFMAHRSNTRWGLESLAVMYGMPFALLVWSIISFFLCFAILWFDNTDYVVMGLVGSVLCIFAFFLFWAVLAPYEKDPYEFFMVKAYDRAREASKKAKRGSVKVIRAMTRRVSSAGTVSSRPVSFSGKVPQPSSWPNPQLAPAGETAPPPGTATPPLTETTFGANGNHQGTWSDAASGTVEGDGDPPGTARSSLDKVGVSNAARRSHERTPWSEKATKFDSQV